MISPIEAHEILQKECFGRYKALECREYENNYRFACIGKGWNGTLGRPQMLTWPIEVNKMTGKVLGGEDVEIGNYRILPPESFLNEKDVRFTKTYWHPFWNYGLIERARKYKLSNELLYRLLTMKEERKETDLFYNFILYYADNDSIRRICINLLDNGAESQAVFETSEDLHGNILPNVRSLIEAYQLLEVHLLPEDIVKEAVETDDYYIFNVAYMDRRYDSLVIVTKLGGKVWESWLYYGDAVMADLFKNSVIRWDKSELINILENETRIANEQYYIDKSLYPAEYVIR